MTLVERADRAEGIEAVGDDGYRRIRSDVVFGRLRPGQKLKLEALKETYGVSVSTLREILSRLTAEGLVIAEGRRGFEVPPVSIDNLKELADLRLLLESHAMQVSFENADVEWEGRVVSAHHKLAVDRTPDGAGHRRARAVEALRRRIPPGADLELRLARPDGDARAGVRQVLSLPDGRLHLSRRRAGAAAQGACCSVRSSATPQTAKAILARHVNNCVEHAVRTGSLR